MHKPVALITGASAGIGFEMAKIFAVRGYDLVVVARTAKKLKEIHTQIPAHTIVTDIPLDLSLPNAAAKLFAATQKKKLKVDVLVNNAGFGSNGRFVELDRKNELQEIDLNVRTLTELCHFYGKEMAARGTGKILNVASTAAFQPGPYMAVYYATKAYVLSFSEAIMEELKPKGVRVSVLCPGPTHTAFVERAGMQGIRLFKNKFMHPMSAVDVAKIGVKQFLRGKKIIIPGFMNKLVAFANRFSPRFLVRKIAASLNRI